MKCFVCGRELRAKTALHFKFMDRHYHLCYVHGFEVRKLILKLKEDFVEEGWVRFPTSRGYVKFKPRKDVLK